MEHVDCIDALLAEGDQQEIADELIDVIEPLAHDDDVLRQLIAHYRDRSHGPLMRVLTFVLSQRAMNAKDSQRNLLYELVPTVLETGDISALTNACSTVQRMAITGCPWHPESADPPPELGDLLTETLRAGSRSATDALGALSSLAQDGYLSKFQPRVRARLKQALDSAPDDIDQDDVATVRLVL